MSLEQAPPPNDPTPGYKPDPLGSDNERRWNGTKWGTQVRPPRHKKTRKMPPWLIVTLSIIGAIIVIGALASEDEPATTNTQEVADGGQLLKDSGQQPISSFPQEFQNAVLESVDEKKPPTFWCRGDECRVYYQRGATTGILISGQEEILEEQRRIWRTMFSRPQTRVARILVDGPVTTVGGKSKVAPILDVTCTRSAASEINWDVVDVDGMSALCDWRELVDF